MGDFSVFFPLILLLIIVAFIVAFLRQKKLSGSALVGVGGWLIFAIIGFVGAILLTTFNLLIGFQNIESLKLIFADTTGKYDVMRAPILLSLLFAVAVITSASVCLYRIFVSKTNVKKIAITHYCILAAAGIVDLCSDRYVAAKFTGEAFDPSMVKDAIRGVLIAAIWIPYFMLSKRVANTFGGAASALPSAPTGDV
jgi:Protein of unknown function (DUF2569)